MAGKAKFQREYAAWNKRQTWGDGRFASTAFHFTVSKKDGLAYVNCQVDWMPQCLQCKSGRVTKGRVENYENHCTAIFRPEGLKEFTLTLAGGTELGTEAFACLDCGLVWSSTSPSKLAAFIEKHCNRKSD